MTGRALPPNNPSSSLSSRVCTEAREVVASNTCALPIFLVRRTAPLTSSRYTMVCTVV